jgi:nucleotide-binding universal stress UspA family protein
MDAAPARPMVVGYDGSARSVAAVDWAAAHAQHHRAALAVLFAHDYPGYPAEAVGRAPASPAAALVSEAAKTADEGADLARARAPGLEVSAQPVFDGPSSALVEASAGAQLLVLGDRGLGALPGFLLGSVARTVSTHAHCPVVVVREGNVVRPGPEMPVVAGVDDSEAAAAALGFAADLAGEYDAPLVALSTWRAPAKPPWGRREAVAGTREAARLQVTEEVVQGLVQRLRGKHPRLRIEASVREGPAPRVLAEASRAAGAVVVGSRGRGGFRGLLLGSTSHDLLHSASCPVIVHRPRARADTGRRSLDQGEAGARGEDPDVGR